MATRIVLPFAEEEFCTHALNRASCRVSERRTARCIETKRELVVNVRRVDGVLYVAFFGTMTAIGSSEDNNQS